MHHTQSFGPEYREIEIGEIIHLATDMPFTLECGVEVRNIPMAYQTYGQLNVDKSNAVLLCHALTGDQYVVGRHPVTGKSGWWEALVGPAKPIDSDKYFIICVNILGGCMGSFGPKTINPETGVAYGLSFPVITIGDMVRTQAMVLDALGVEKLFAVIGGSLGGMQVLEWARRYPERVHAALPLATAIRQSAQNIAFHEIGRQAIMADPDWQEGDYLTKRTYPSKGLAVARMAAHVTYMSEPALQDKFGRNLQDRDAYTFGFEADFQIESYLRHQGMAFIERFDANSYLYLTRAASYFDMTEGGKTKMAEIYKDTPVRFLIISFTSDWLYPTKESQKIVKGLNAAGAEVSFAEITSDRGHDAFLLDIPELQDILRGFLQGAHITLGQDQ